MEYDRTRWRKLSTTEKEKLKKFLSLENKIANVFFRIPQVVVIIVTVALFVSLITDWDKYSQDMFQTIIMVFFGVPCLWCMFFFIPKLLIKVVNREVNAIDSDMAVVSERLITDKCIGYEGSSANGRPRRVYEFEVFEGLERRMDRYVHTNSYAYEHLNIGDTCYVVFFPKKESGTMHTAYMDAFCVGFEEIDRIFKS